MTQAQTEVVLTQIQVCALRPTGLNPRKAVDDGPLEELTASVQLRGVLVPLLVRPAKKGKGFEIVAGERRWRAAKKAKLATVPAIVEDMNDELALETMVVENGQREDILPLEEADGYQKLAEYGREPSEIAARVGRGVRHVLQRMSLGQLIEPARIALREEKILLGHAMLLARLPEERQAPGLEAAMRTDHFGRQATVEQLRGWLDNRQRNINSAPFKASDAGLIEKAGACAECPKRTGATPELFPEGESPNICLDPDCFEEKLELFVNLQLAAAEEAGEELLLLGESYMERGDGILPKGKFKLVESKHRCEHAKPALWVSGPDRGRRCLVCVVKACDKHWEAWERGSDSGQKGAATRRSTLAKKKRMAAIGERLRQAAVKVAAESMGERPLLFLCRSAIKRGGSEATRLYAKALLLLPGEKISKLDHRKRVLDHIGEMADSGGAKSRLGQFLVSYAVMEEVGRASFYTDGLKGLKESAVELGLKFEPMVKAADAALKRAAATPRRKKAAKARTKAKGGVEVAG